MKTFKSTLVALTIAFVSSIALSGCFVDDEEIFGQVDAPVEDAQQDNNEEQWGE